MSSPKKSVARKSPARKTASKKTAAKKSVAKPASPEPAQHTRIIKKYANRRLYDTQTSSYVTVADVRQLVIAHDHFVVQDARSGEDLTRSVLLQIILEEEAAGAPIFSTTMLGDIIRFYGHAMQGFMGTYLEKNFRAMVELQNKLAEQSPGWTPEMWTQFMSAQSPAMQGMMSHYLEQSQNTFVKMQEQMAQQAEQMLGAWGVKR